MGRFSGFLFNFFREKSVVKIWWLFKKCLPLHSLLRNKPSDSGRDGLGGWQRRCRKAAEVKKKNVKNLQVWKIGSNFAKHFRPSSGRHSKPEHIEIIAIDEVVQENKGRRPGASRPADEVSVKFDQRLDSRLSAGRKMSSDGCRCPMGLLILVQAMRL